MNWFKKAETTVETILSGWLKTIEDLEAHAVSKMTEAAKHNALVMDYEALADAAHAEVEKANAVAAKIKALFN